MRKIVVNKLVLGKEIIGYRFDIVRDDTRAVSIDIDRRVAKHFLSMVDADNVVKGNIIKGRLEGDLFVTDDESLVVEVTNSRQANEILKKFYYVNSNSAVDNLLDSIDETAEDEKNRRLSQHQKDMDALITGARVDLSKFEYGKSFSIPLANTCLEIASKGVECNIDAIEDDDFRFFVRFARVDEYFKFLINLLRILKFSTIDLNLGGYSRKYALNTPLGDMVSDFHNGVGVLSEDLYIEEGSSNGILTWCEGELLVLEFDEPIPSYETRKYSEFIFESDYYNPLWDRSGLGSSDYNLDIKYWDIVENFEKGYIDKVNNRLDTYKKVLGRTSIVVDRNEDKVGLNIRLSGCKGISWEGVVKDAIAVALKLARSDGKSAFDVRWTINVQGNSEVVEYTCKTSKNAKTIYNEVLEILNGVLSKYKLGYLFKVETLKGVVYTGGVYYDDGMGNYLGDFVYKEVIER